MSYVVKINIIGLGPRGLAVALYALSRGIEVRAYDPQPLHGWSNATIPDLRMRSPITFDLATYLDEDYTLANYLGTTTITNTQQDIEADNRRCDRSTFEKYLQHCLSLAIKQGLDLIPEKVLKVNPDEHTVIATGDRLGYRLPTWLTHSEVYPLSYYLQINIQSHRILVVGSGQGAAEAVAYLSLNNQVIWSKKKSIIDEYPAPSYRHWKGLSALGPYYRSLSSDSSRLRYLQRVKAWGPSITPHIASILSERNFSTIDVIRSSSDIPDVDYICVATGYKPILGVDVEYTSHLMGLPKVESGFRLNNKTYVTGPAAILYDGPRQNSLISAGITARDIINQVTYAN